MRKSYKVVYERDEDGVWYVTIPAVRGCHSHARSLVQARERIREALGLFVPGASTARLEDDIRLPPDVARLIKTYVAASERTEEERTKAEAAKQRSLRALKKAHFTVRDAGALLGLSHQRVHQLLAKRREVA